MTRTFEHLLVQIPARMEGQVKKTVREARRAIQDALRSECRLSLRTATADEKHLPSGSVPVIVESGCIFELRNLPLTELDELLLLFRSYQTSIENMHHGSESLKNLNERLQGLKQRHREIETRDLILKDTSPIDTTLCYTQRLLDFIKELTNSENIDPNPGSLLKRILAMKGALGVYQFKYDEHQIDGCDVGHNWDDDFSVNPAQIRLFWGVIGFTSQWMGCEVESLATVVLCHELAHAYTQLGADIEGRRWSAAKFSQTDDNVVEGLAQYYTERVLNKLSRRFPDAIRAFESLLEHQSEPYTIHKKWIEGDYDSESIRLAMLEFRRHQETKIDAFARRLSNARSQLGRRPQPDTARDTF